VTPDLETLADRLERAAHADDSLEGERLRRMVRARLLDETAPDPRIDRYVILGRLGEGGMGVVYRAYDAELDRKVAIKLVRHVGDRQRAAVERQRLLAEARSLAQLSHPNVVAIYDVGVHGDAVFIAMELVHGDTLRAFAAAGKKSWREILRAYRQAGEGLAAVHDAGLVHRDFKPDNVLVGDDGRVRVADFGLAREDASLDSEVSDPGDAVPRSSLTATGKVVGTPAYMAPEQYAGRQADARTDQFSFCVSLWEALHRVRPFPPDDTSAIAEGRVKPPAEQSRVPEWLRAVLLRGLSPDPAARWPSMRALLTACGRDPTPRRRAAAAVGVVLFGTGVALVGAEIANTRAAAECRARAQGLSAVWNDAVDGEISTAFAAAGLDHGAATAARVRTRVWAWHDEWAAARGRACTDHAVTHAIADDARARRDACLDEHAERLAMLVDILREADRGTVNHAVRAVLQLPPISECEDDARLRVHDPAGSIATLEARRELARSSLLETAGRARDAYAAADAARKSAIEAGDATLEAEADLRAGEAHLGQGDYDEAEAILDRAYFTATRAGADEVALDAATQLVMVVGNRLARYDDGLTWSRHARGLLARVGEGHDFRAAKLEEFVANVQRTRGDFAAAQASYERALELWTAHAGPDSPQVGDALTNLGSLLTEHGEIDESERALAKAEPLLVAAYGEDALELVSLIATRCSNAFARGDLPAALLHCRRALAIREARLTPDHPSIAIALTNLATAHVELGQLDEARPLLQRALAIRRMRLGASHPSVALSLSNLGVLEANAGDLELSLKLHTEALEIRRRTLPSGHVDQAISLLNLADVLVAKDQPERAEPHVQEALAIGEAAEAPAIVERARALKTQLE
jgi:tetratricopeptide (TPR) repeat protein/predicted Ser/Thr protein kinase